MAKENGRAYRAPLGRFAVAVIENNDDQGKTWFNVKYSRYSVREDRWKEVSSFYRNELPLVEKGADMAFRWILDQRFSTTSDSPNEAEE